MKEDNFNDKADSSVVSEILEVVGMTENDLTQEQIWKIEKTIAAAEENAYEAGVYQGEL